MLPSPIPVCSLACEGWGVFGRGAGGEGNRVAKNDGSGRQGLIRGIAEGHQLEEGKLGEQTVLVVPAGLSLCLIEQVNRLEDLGGREVARLHLKPCHVLRSKFIGSSGATDRDQQEIPKVRRKRL